MQMLFINEETMLASLQNQGLLAMYQSVRQGLGEATQDRHYLADLLRIPQSLCFALETLCLEQKEIAAHALDSIALFSLCKGLFLPLSGVSTSQVGQLFGFAWHKPARHNKELVETFLAKPLGLSLSEKVAYLMGDPFYGGNARMGQDTLLQVLATIRLMSAQKLRERLPRVGDIALLFTEECEKLRSDPAITVREALLILKRLPDVGTLEKKEILQDLFLRAGRLERYYLVRLILRRLNFGYDYRQELVVNALASHYKVAEQAIENGIALTDIFTVTRLLERQGEAGLKKLVLKPLNPVSPALAGHSEIGQKSRFPLWVECKYDGIRLMLHKDTSSGGRVKYAAFTRRKYDWLELIPALETAAPWIAARSFILDGELYARIPDIEGKGWQEASVYQIYRYLQGDNTQPLRLQYIVFDILYLNGREVSHLPLTERRKMLEGLISPLARMPLAMPILLSAGWEVHSAEEFHKWYRYFLQQGHEGAIAKIPDSLYALGKRTNDWLKKKEAICLDLLITGAQWAAGSGGPQVISAYHLACKENSGLREIGRAEGLAQPQNWEIMQRILNEGLFTGKNFEVRSASGLHAGIEITPAVVVTVRFEDVIRSSHDVYSLRDPKIVCVRPRGDTAPHEIDSYETIRRLYLQKSLS
jgi:DNA ligase-1